MSRTEALQNFADALRECLQLSAMSPAARSVADRIFSAADRPATPADAPPIRLPVCRYLAPALKQVRRHGGSSARLADALVHLEPSLRWLPRPPGPDDEEGFRDHHANAVVIGEGGIEMRSDIRIGISLLAPHTRYPDHRHPPEEVYSVLSLGEWRQLDNPWHEPGIGGVVHNPPNVLHAMRSKAAPLLAVWCLLIDDS